MWVKICGNTNLEDAQLAAELGADAVGFVFAPSVRQVTPAEAGRITAQLPVSLERVGVFPAWTAEAIGAAVREAGLTTAQLHGSINLDTIAQLYAQFGNDLRIIQVVHWVVGDDASSQARVALEIQQLAQSTKVDRVLIDSKVGAAMGGTGVSFDWTAAQATFAASHAGVNLILAGGLTPQNVAEATERLRPWGVDVASGVESRAGRKDPEKLASFMQRARTLHEGS